MCVILILLLSLITGETQLVAYVWQKVVDDSYCILEDICDQ